MDHTRGRPYHPLTEVKIGRFVDHYTNERDHESLNNLTPADVYYGLGVSILARRE